MTPFRIGYGYDVHRLVEGRDLWLGGVKVPAEKGALGHSDADVLLHAICDALLGAAGSGDIGTHFPDTDAAWKDADSRDLLRRVKEIISADGWTVGNVDATLVLEKPKIKPHVSAMRETIAGILDIDLSAVGIKATTNEGMGFVGRGEGVCAHAVALLVRA
ncbi:MAG: 2-C-methyl-D-erythritol 2,4-cyclodiphosphate synthase [Flavobacteriales bacterium]|nr:2-C-methyl-D-erythritol 2,4-cyclodiphosphate synthase [Flavobacteriales bacterium]MCB0813066.1 2-C-methyl-D-erythritol 2,4-cyclodiphosphate synthase [Flavobacteriales bacterium]MCB0816539.1 2-C-methyl-D-erythritol 2,4-cyclodiphosphate synthase [Flavobacteriales bacterium]HPJ52061.1 2-C-methyl-D-erythritol 2,4-cyclodiphosphate synthase [Flavobacteriales bacterium]HPQ58793.1 2-C-methyl-D-erythritol 2,4-cyclodiphosphate synthase [Flavobacteriales bacterium]